jgi:hypothetical protein
MALPNVKINRKKGGLKRVQPTTDNVFGLAISGAAVVGKIALAEPKLFTGVEDLVTLGITDANNPLAYAEVNAFYEKAGAGTKLWVMLYAPATLLADLCDKDTGVLRNIMSVANGEVRGLFVNKTLPGGYAVNVVEGLDSDVWNGVAKAQALCEAWGDQNDPTFLVLPGIGFLAANAANLRDLNTMSADQVSICLAADTLAGKCAIGTTAGWLSKLPVQRNMGAVENGSVLEAAWLIDGTVANAEAIKPKLDLIHDHRYIIFRKHKGKSGFYFNDDPTACAKSSDFSSISWNRVVNKAHVIAAAKLTDKLLADVDTDAADGSISAALAADWESDVQNEIEAQMLRKKEISGVRVLIDPSQVNVTTDEMSAEIEIIRKGQAKSFLVNIGYVQAITI